MIMLDAYFSPQHLKNAIQILYQLEHGMTPQKYGLSERGRRHLLDDTGNNKIATMIESQQGFFLFAPDIKYNIEAVPQNSYCHVTAFSHTDIIQTFSSRLLGAMAAARTDFAFVATWDEYVHRNRCVKELRSSSLEFWVGRNLNKYIPGIYFKTIIPINRMPIIHICNSPFVASGFLNNDQYVAMGTCDVASRWKQHREDVDEWLASNNLFFAKSRVLQELGETATREEILDAQAKWD